ncbi:MAG TPA: MASE1 domain-containing protein [Burkholderiaceae bacterium]|nr:MASE1 domain-containing protein [Burkholderiaceae bacterium]
MREGARLSGLAHAAAEHLEGSSSIISSMCAGLGPSLRRWGVQLAFVLVFLALDWVSYIRPFQGLNITPWNPHPALAVALLMWNRRYLWLVWLALVTAELAVRGVPADWLATLAATATLAFAYAAIARALTLRVESTLALATRRDLFWFAGIVIGGSLLAGGLYIATFAAAGHGPSGPLHEAIARFWVGDAVGIVVFLPMCLFLLDGKRRASLVDTLRTREWWLIATLVCSMLFVVFSAEEGDHFKFFYLLFLPAVWASARFGVAGAVLCAALTQGGLIIALQSVPGSDLSVFELQVLMAALALTGLMLGVTVDERERAARELKGSLHLAAAGQMAAALAHELSQPLTALNQYARATRMLAEATDMSDSERLARFALVTAQIGDDAARATDVVRRLRDFFRSGGTQLRLASLAHVIEETVDGSRRRANAQGTAIEKSVEQALPPVLMDPVQIAVVLRNVLANAIDATAQGAAPGQVNVRARMDKDTVLVEVLDNGPGVSKAKLQSLFEAGPSEKPGGMGVGLSICRAIIEAHGGLLWVRPGPSGHFCFTLPVEQPPSKVANAS